MSEPQKIIVDKNQQDKVVKMISESKSLRSQLPLKGPEYGYRFFLLSKDRSYINEVVDENSHVHGKGELMTVLEREKYSSLVVETYLLREPDQ